jgi:hypothetical protein
MTEIPVFTVAWRNERTQRVSVEMYTSDRAAWQRCCQLVAAGFDAQIGKHEIEVLR